MQARNSHIGSFVLATLFFAGIALLAQAPAGSGRGTRGGRGGGIGPDKDHPIMPIGTHIPDFTLPGADGKAHSLKEWNSAKFLMIVFECDHCPESQDYESRIKQLYEDYKGKGVQLVAINPNDPASVRLDELGYTDLEDSLPEMKMRLADRHIDWPYLYDGATQEVATKFGVVATPHVFIFDQDRKLRFEGEIDDNQNQSLIRRKDTREALDELLAGKPVTVTDTRVHGCTTKWKSKQIGSQSREAEMQKIMKEPVNLETVDADGLKTLRANTGTNKVMMVTFWSTKCAYCADSLYAMETTWRMFRLRAFDFVTINTDPVADKDAVMKVLDDLHASGKNRQSTVDLAAAQAAFGEKWKPGAMFTEVIASDGKILYKHEGMIAKGQDFGKGLQVAPPQELLLLRRSILANMPDTAGYPGNKAYWDEDYQKIAKK